MGPPIGSYQAIAHPLARAKINVDLAAMMAAKAAWPYDRREASDCANTAIGVWSANSLDRSVVVAVYGQPA